MFERYTEKARRVIFFARYEASLFGSPYIETEHLLLGLLREDNALAKRLQRSGASMESIRAQIERRTPAREKVSTSVDLPLSQECKRVLQYAPEEAERLSHRHIGTEHLLLGLLREDKSFAAEILHERGLRLSTIREELARPQIKKPPSDRPKDSPLLSVFSRDLTQAASENQLEPVFGRENELERVVQVLCRRTKNNPVLTGERGAGKKAIVEGLAQRIAGGGVPSRLGDKRILDVDLLPIMVVTRQSGGLERRLMTILTELIEAQNLIIFVEDLYAQRGANRSLGAANVLKRALTRGEIQCIASATPGDYGKSIEKEPWLEECFQAVKVPPPDEAAAIQILFTIKVRYEMFHGVTYTDEALKYAVYYSNRYVPNRALPGKAVDLIDEAGAYATLRQGSLPEEVIEVQKRIKFVAQRMENDIANHEFEKAEFYSEEERKERENLRLLYKKHKLAAAGISTVTLEDIEEIVARWAGIPVATIRQERSSAGPGGQGGQAS